jgi:hypothetical protein
MDARGRKRRITPFRLAEHDRRALQAAATENPPAPIIDPETERQREEKTSADLARTEQRLAQVQASQAARRPDTDKTIWAAATTDVAREFTAELDALSPAERHAATNRIAALASVAEQLLSGQPLPPTILNPNAQA